MRILPYLIAFTGFFLSSNLFYNLFLPSPINTLLTIGFFVFYSYLLGYIFFRYYDKYDKFFGGLLLLISLISILGTIIYYIKNLKIEYIGLIIILLSSSILLGFIITYYKYYKPQILKKRILQHKFNTLIKIQYSYSTIIIIALSLAFILLSIESFKILIESQFSEATRSPWNFIPNHFLYIYIINTFLLSIITLFSKTSRFSLLLTSIHYFLSLSIAVIVYKVGYGFDPFIHKATEQVIFELGQILPKTFYYIGHYSLVVIFAQIFKQISPALIDTYLVSIIYSIFVPWSIYFFSKNVIKMKSNFAAFFSMFGLIIPLGFFITTTPQSFANTLLIITIFLGSVLLTSKKLSWWVIAIVVIATTTIHPLGGIPALIFLMFLSIYYFFNKYSGFAEFIRKSIYIELFFIASIIIPSVFIALSYINGNTLSSAFKSELLPTFFKSIFETITSQQFLIQNKYTLIGDLSYGYINSYYLIIIILSILAVFIAYRKKELDFIKHYIITFFALLINFILLATFISFDGLIEYERGDFAQRVLYISFYFLIPLIIYLTYKAIEQARKSKNIFAHNFIIFITVIAISSTMYTAYPREDGYVYSKGYNATQADITTVYYINNDAQKNKTNDYIVLANQTVSAIALHEFGFNKYYSIKDYGELFYYPVPTSSPLYQFYLDMVYKEPSRQTMLEAGEFMNVRTVYFVINKYWARSREIVSSTKKIADSWTSFDNGQVHVFKFILKD